MHMHELQVNEYTMIFPCVMDSFIAPRNDMKYSPPVKQSKSNLKNRT